MYIFHESRSDNLDSIIKNGLLKTSLSREKFTKQGQGTRTQRLSSDPATLDYNTYDSVDAIYFRVVKYEQDVRPMHGGDVIILIKPSVLNKKKWYFNSVENQGFYLDAEKASPFTGEIGKTIQDLPSLINFRSPEQGELVVLSNSISSKDFSKIIITF